MQIYFKTPRIVFDECLDLRWSHVWSFFHTKKQKSINSLLQIIWQIFNDIQVRGMWCYFSTAQFQSVSSKWAFIQRAVLFVVWVQKGLLFITLPYICTNTTPRCSAGFWRWFILTVRCICSSCNVLGLTWVQPQLCLCSSISWLLSLQLKLSSNLWEMFLQPSPEPQYWQSLFSDLLRITLRIQFCQCSVSKRSTTWKFPP